MTLEEMKKEAADRMHEKSRSIQERLKGIKYKVAVYSGKGGVGKTTVAVNLATALAKQGKKVGFLDADIDCPNANVLFGISEKTHMKDGFLQPIERYGVKVISMSMLVEDDAAIMWRGPMLTKAVGDFLFNTEWGDIEYLIVDLPPGTSDSPITIIQLLDLTGFIMVTTPQALARGDMARSANMVKKMNIPILATVENMCSDTFGCTKNNGYLHIKLDQVIAKRSDEGVPAVLKSGKLFDIYAKIAEKIDLNK